MVTTERSNDIIVREITGIEDSTALLLPIIESIRDNLRRIRNKTNGFVYSGVNDIPEILKNDIRGNLFVQYDSGVMDNDRTVIFFSEFKKRIFSKINTFVIDATFRTSPSCFHQLLVIHGHIFGRHYPLIYILMKNEKESTYKKVFEKVKQLVEVRPKTIIIDFERALLNAIGQSFTGVKLQGYLFHLASLCGKE